MNARTIDLTGPRLLALLLCAAGALAATAARASDEMDDVLLWSVGEFQLGNGDQKTIADFRSPEPFRICVRQASHSIPLKVDADGRSTTVATGACNTFDARRISISPAARLADDTVLIGRYQHVRK